MGKARSGPMSRSVIICQQVRYRSCSSEDFQECLGAQCSSKGLFLSKEVVREMQYVESLLSSLLREREPKWQKLRDGALKVRKTCSAKVEEKLLFFENNRKSQCAICSQVMSFLKSIMRIDTITACIKQNRSLSGKQQF